MFACIISLSSPRNDKKETIDDTICKTLEKLTSDLLCSALLTFGGYNTITMCLMIFNSNGGFLDFSIDSIIRFSSIMLPSIIFLWVISLIGQSANILISHDNRKLNKGDIYANPNPKTTSQSSKSLPEPDGSPGTGHTTNGRG